MHVHIHPSPREKWETRKSPGGGGDRTQAISFRWLSSIFFRLSDCSHCFIHILYNSSLENLDDFPCIANLWPLSENDHEIEYKCSLRGRRLKGKEKEDSREARKASAEREGGATFPLPARCPLRSSARLISPIPLLAPATQASTSTTFEFHTSHIPDPSLLPVVDQ